jgi:hypothetical protein
MSDLFAIEESKSPRLKWLEKHGITLKINHQGEHVATTRFDSGKGETEDDAITQLALKLGIRMWFEEGMR